MIFVTFPMFVKHVVFANVLIFVKFPIFVKHKIIVTFQIFEFFIKTNFVKHKNVNDLVFANVQIFVRFPVLQKSVSLVGLPRRNSPLMILATYPCVSFLFVAGVAVHQLGPFAAAAAAALAFVFPFKRPYS